MHHFDYSASHPVIHERGLRMRDAYEALRISRCMRRLRRRRRSAAIAAVAPATAWKRAQACK